jgi:hypothetical protein
MAAVAVVYYRARVSIFERQVGRGGIFVVKSVTSTLLATFPPGSQRIVGGGMAGRAIIAVDCGQVGVVADDTINEDIEVRLFADPSRVIVIGVGENDYRATAWYCGVIEVSVDILKAAVAG